MMLIQGHADRIARIVSYLGISKAVKVTSSLQLHIENRQGM
jgi:hypothetical protein